MKKLLILLLIVGCAGVPFQKDIVLHEVVVHIRNDCDGEMGWAQENNEICVWGYEYNGIIIPDYAVLGHEIAHLLNLADNTIKDPDKHTSPNFRPIGKK